MLRYCYHCKLNLEESCFSAINAGLIRAGRPVGRCKECVALRNKAYRLANPDKLKIYEKNRQCPKRKEVNRRAGLKRKYGITPEEYDKMREDQNYSCAICGMNEEEHKVSRWGNLCVDHNHITGKVRKLLCAPCNKGLGCFKDNSDLIKKAAEYLDESI
jgi:hypothetical protein